MKQSVIYGWTRNNLNVLDYSLINLLRDFDFWVDIVSADRRKQIANPQFSAKKAK